jgi:prolipoprotein diacylglyceryltransferase
LSVSVSDADILAAQAELDELEPRLAELRRQIPQAASAAERQRLEAEQHALEQVLPKKRAEYFDIRAQMALYNLTPQELRALAREYPSLPVHPTQLYSVVVLVVLALLLNALYWRRTRDGQVFFTFLVLEPPTRWLLEVLRDDNPVDTLGTLTISQFIAIAVVLVGVAGLVWLRSQPPRSPRARRWEPPAVEGSDRKKPATAPR